MTSPTTPKPFAQASNARRRKWTNCIVLSTFVLLLLLCLVPLVSVMYRLIAMGVKSISIGFLTRLPLETPPGIGNSIVGSVLLLVFASLFAVPLGLMIALFLSQRPEAWSARLARLLLDVMSGIPAIVVGMFIYALVVMPMGGASLLAGSLSLAMIMLPVFARTSEEAIKAIPSTVTEAGLGLGLTRRRVIGRILLRSATPSMLTGLFLAIARVAGEAAPLLFTSLDSNHWPTAGPRVLTEQTAALPVTIFEMARRPFPEDYERAWGAALILVGLILLLRFSTNLLVRWRYGQGGTHV